MRHGFSLVELSIVLVILGLLTGGILGGRALIHAAELRSVTSEMQQFQTAINAFHDKYGNLPGDFNEAETLWGGPVADCLMTDSGDTTTCNGDGDGRIDYDNGAVPYGDTPYEGLRAWQHLVNSGMLPGIIQAQLAVQVHTPITKAVPIFRNPNMIAMRAGSSLISRIM